nr:RNA polymerase sigma factor [Salinispira pacifica]
MNQQEFNSFITPYIPRLYRSILSMVRNATDAEDIIQEAVMRAYTNISRYDSSRPFYPWLLTIGRNLARNFLSRRNSRESSAEVPLDIPEIHSSNPELSAIKREEIRSLYKALEELSPEHRQIIELKHFQECSYNEISEILSIPRGTVMSRLYYARKQLQAALESQE